MGNRWQIEWKCESKSLSYRSLCRGKKSVGDLALVLVLLLMSLAAGRGASIYAGEPVDQETSANVPPVATETATGTDQAEELPSVLNAEDVRRSIQRAIPLLERASAGSADQRTCFTCHTQAIPVFALVEAERRGFQIDAANLARQVEHTHAHLQRGLERYREGQGQGGKVDTAGYALWTLEEAQHQGSETTAAVLDYILNSQKPEGHWQSANRRPPTVISHFTTTYLALRALSVETHLGQNATAENGAVLPAAEFQERRAQAEQRAVAWLKQGTARDTEDRVFRLLSSRYVELPASLLESWQQELVSSQRSDGGWAQEETMKSDAYATATVLYVLEQLGVPQNASARTRGVTFLLQQQLEDGSWHVVSRSRPFQAYYESGFPHGPDQFISTAATAWAILALLNSLPEQTLD